MLINYCLYCDNIASPLKKLCPTCEKRLNCAVLDSYLEECPVCGYPLVSTVYSCENCKTHRGLKIKSILSYKDSFARNFLEMYKFDKHKEFACLFASIIRNYIDDDECVVPIPSSNYSLKKRGWDQMLLIAKRLGTPYCSLLKNNYDSEIQSKNLSEKERIEFSKNKFVIASQPLFSFNVKKYGFGFDTRLVIIDDVFTTGSTMFSAYNTLKNAGYANVRGITLYAEI